MSQHKLTVIHLVDVEQQNTSRAFTIPTALLAKSGYTIDQWWDSRMGGTMQEFNDFVRFLEENDHSSTQIVTLAYSSAKFF